MCGLTGFALHPDSDADTRTKATLVFTDLMWNLERRGKHATGIATNRGYLFKKAVDVRTLVKSSVWDTIVDATRESTITLGHVRYSTHPQNTHLDASAHPFVEGRITGAHNGIIYNWRDVATTYDIVTDETSNDSQAPFWLLDRIKNPVKALDTLDGYWALTWIKGDSLFMCRTSDAPLTCAYVPSLRTLFWHSEYVMLKEVLAMNEIADFEIWDVKPNTIYRFSPAAFDANGTNRQTIDAPFNGRKSKTSAKDSWRTSGGVTTRQQLPSPYLTTRVRHVEPIVAVTNAKQLDAELRKPGRVVSLLDLERRLDVALATIAELRERLDALEGAGTVDVPF